MSLLDYAVEDGRSWVRVGDRFEVTKKPRSTDVRSTEAVPFLPMELIPQGGRYEPAVYDLRPTQNITSGTYFERGDALIAKITPSFENGKQALVKGMEQPFGYATTEVIPLHAKTADGDVRFLFFFLLHPAVRHYLAERMEGSTGRQRVSENLLLNLPMPALCPKDQAAAADVFEAIHAAIQAEERAVGATARLKAAALRDLFTRGLRGEAQKETEIGLIPQSWELKSIVELCEIWSGGTPRKSNAEFWTGEIPWVSGKDLKRPVLHDAADHVSVSGVEAYSRLAPEDSVLILVRGMGLAKDLPVAVISRPMAFNQDVKALVTRGQFTGAFLRSAIYAGKERLLSQLAMSAHGTKTLNLNDVETFLVPGPAESGEADDIVEILNAIDKKSELHRKKRDVLDQLFRSLLHKLMTGDISVDDLDLSALPTAPGSAA